MIRDALRRRRWSLAWLLGLIGLGVLLAVLAFVPILRQPSDGRTGLLVGHPAPMLAAMDLDGRSWTLDDGDGRIVWVNFWATSCEPCRTEMPAMQVLADEHADQLLILGVDWGEGRDAVRDFVDR